MSRNLTASIQTELSASSVRLAVFVEAFFNTGPLRVWSGIGSITWNSETWLGVGDLISVAPANETSEVRATGAEFTLQGLDPTIVSLVLDEGRQGKTIRAWLGFLDSSEAIIADPYLFFSGTVDTFLFEEEGDAASITLLAESHLSVLQRSNLRRYTHEDQQTDYPGDLGFNVVTGIQEWTGTWGR